MAQAARDDPFGWTNVGAIFRDRDHHSRVPLGSCFCFGRASVFVTAAHCVKDEDRARLWVNHFGAEFPDLMSPVHKVVAIDEADIAILVTEAPRPQFVTPFRSIRPSFHYGEEVGAMGFPTESPLITDDATETLRAFRGNIQRGFIHKSTRATGNGYRAYELSFRCPFGMSGAAVFPISEPETVLGVITEDVKVGTLLSEEHSVEDNGARSRSEIRSVINYGVASSLVAAAEVLEAETGLALRPYTSA
jgi:Trypsin-like peptidase domain